MCKSATKHKHNYFHVLSNKSMHYTAACQHLDYTYTVQAPEGQSKALGLSLYNNRPPVKAAAVNV